MYCVSMRVLCISVVTLTILSCLASNSNSSSSSISKDLIAVPSIPQVEIDALQDLYNYLEGSWWKWDKEGQNWNFSGNPMPCDGWQGVTCYSVPDGYSSNVMWLDLSIFDLIGSLPASIGNFSKIRSIDVRSNFISGSIPSDVSRLGQLESLYLDSNYFQGQVPVLALANCSHLTDFHVAYNKLSGSIADEWSTLPALVTLDLTMNEFHGQLPASLSSLSTLSWFSISNCLFTGTIPPEFGQMSNLVTLQAQSNKMHGTIPSELTKCNSLSEILLGSNLFTGTLPQSLNELQRLTYLELDNNMFNGTIPASLFECPMLNQVALSNNKFTGTIPPQIGNCTGLLTLGLNENQLWGTIPDVFAGMQKLGYIQMLGNQLEGPLPASLSNCSSMWMINLGNNALDGTLPAEWSLMSNLQFVTLSSNFIKGGIPDEWVQLNKTLTSLMLSNNSLSGSLPEDIGNLTRLTDFDLTMNHIRGSIPASFGSLSIYEVLLSFNELEGTIPPELFENPNLVRVDLSTNRLEGTLPSTVSKLKNVWFFNVSTNRLHGSIPEEIKNMKILQILSLDNNRLEGSIPVGLLSLKQLSGLYLSSNNIGGTIPAGFDGMLSLESLFLNNNHFSGSTVSMFNGTLQHLINVDLSDNQLTGPLPSEVFRIASLQTFSAVTNCFTGSIPADTICRHAVSLSALALDGLQSASSCQKRFFSSASSSFWGVHSYGITEGAISGGVPECLFLMDSLRVLHLSGNGLTGTLPDHVVINPQLEDLSLSHNNLRGPLPWFFQVHNWSRVDYSYNKFDGYLTTSIPFIPDNVYVALDVNRLSGSIPSSFREAKQIEMLNGNLFACGVFESGLPLHDSYRQKYECGSSAFNFSIYIWVACFGCCLAAIGFLSWLYSLDAYAAAQGFRRWVQTTRALRRGVVRWWKVYQLPQYSDISLLGYLLKRIRHFSILVTAFIVLVLMPVFITLSMHFNSYSEEYAYVTSAAYLTGKQSARSMFILFLLLGCVCCWLHYFYFGGSGSGGSSASAAGAVKAETDKEEFDRSNARGWSGGVLAACVVAVLFDMLVVLAVNIGYVLISTSYSPAIVRLSQVFVVLFKLMWNNVVVPLLMRSLRDAESKDLRVGSFMILFNNLAAPFVATSLVSANCFKYVFWAPPQVTTSYYYERCVSFVFVPYANSTICAENVYTSALSSTSYDPPFLYSYQCSSTILSTYASIYVIMFIVSGFVSPLLQWLAYFLYQHTAESPNNSTTGSDSSSSSSRWWEMVHALLGLAVPVLWRANSSSSTRSSLMLSNDRRKKALTSPLNAESESVWSRWVSALMLQMQQPSAAFNYFDCDLFILRIINMLSIIVTFGAVFPPIAGVGCITLLFFVCFTQLLIGRFVTHSDSRRSAGSVSDEGPGPGKVEEVEEEVETGGLSVSESAKTAASVTMTRTHSRGVSNSRSSSSEDGLRLSRINEDCMYCDLMYMGSVWIIVPFAVVIYSLFLLDTLGDDVGWRHALWLPLLLCMTPLVFLLGKWVKRACWDKPEDQEGFSSSSGRFDRTQYDVISVLHESFSSRFQDEESNARSARLVIDQYSE